MKGLYLPDTVERFILPNLKPVPQVVFYKLLRYSSQTYHGNIWPSIATLCRLCKIQEKKTVRAALNEIESWGLISRKPNFKNNRQTSNIYTLTFDIFEMCDKMRGIKFSRRSTQSMFSEINNRLKVIEHEQKDSKTLFKEWCQRNKFSIPVGGLDQPEIDISYLSAFNQAEFKQAASKHGLLLNFRAS